MTAEVCGYWIGRRRCGLPSVEDGWCDTHAADEVAIERAMLGDRVPLLVHERAEAVRRLAGRALFDHQIADLLHITSRNVCRIRTREGIPSAVQTTVIPGYSVYREFRHQRVSA